MQRSRLKQQIDKRAHRILDRLPNSGLAGSLVEFLIFGIKQAWAFLFGGLLFLLMIISFVRISLIQRPLNIADGG